MNDEIAHQDELINKLNKEKKHAMETQAKSSDELTSAEEKMENLNKIKTKLEVSYKSKSKPMFQNIITVIR